MARVLFGFLTLFALLALGVWLKFGGGNRYGDVNTAARLDADAIERVFRYDQPIGDLAFSADDTLFFSIHPAAQTNDNQVLRLSDGLATPFPDRSSQQQLFDTVAGLTIDNQDRLWVIDHGRFGFGQPRLMAFDVADGSIAFDLPFNADLAPKGSLLQDVAVSVDGQFAFVADTSLWRESPALLVVDLVNGNAQRLLVDHPALSSQQWQIHNPDGDLTFLGGLLSLMPGVDALSVSPDGQWLYLAAMSHDGVFRISLDEAASGSIRPERYGDKPLTDAIVAAPGGRIYLTDIEHTAILELDGRRRLSTLVQTDQLRWPSALALDSNGDLYIADAAVPLVLKPPLQGDPAPFSIYRLTL